MRKERYDISMKNGTTKNMNLRFRSRDFCAVIIQSIIAGMGKRLVINILVPMDAR